MIFYLRIRGYCALDTICRFTYDIVENMEGCSSNPACLHYTARIVEPSITGMRFLSALLVQNIIQQSAF